MIKRLPDLCDIQYGYAFDSSMFCDDKQYPQLARIRDVKRGYSETFYSGEYSDEYVLKKNDLLIGMDGEFNIARWNIDGALLNQRVCKIKAKKDINEEYIRYALTKKLKQIENRTSFVTVKHLSAKELSKIEIDLPVLNEQNTIVSQLNTLEKVITIKREQISELDNLVKSRFVEMFETLDLSEKRKDWVEIGTVSTIYTGTTPSTTQEENWDGDVLWITPAEIDDNSFWISDTVRKITKKGQKSKSLALMPIGTVLLSTRAPIGKVGIVGKEMTCNQGFKNFYCDKNIINPVYLYTLLKHNTEYLNSIGTGTTFKEISRLSISKLLIPIPNISKQNEFANFVMQTDKSKFRIIQYTSYVNFLHCFDSPSHSA